MTLMLVCQPSVQILSHVKPNMTHSRQMLVIRDFIKVFLTRSNTTGRSFAFSTQIVGILMCSAVTLNIVLTSY